MKRTPSGEWKDRGTQSGDLGYYLTWSNPIGPRLRELGLPYVYDVHFLFSWHLGPYAFPEMLFPSLQDTFFKFSPLLCISWEAFSNPLKAT